MLPFTLSFLDDVVPDNYRLPVTASVSGGDAAAPTIYRPLYKDWEIQKFVNSNRLDAFGKDGAEVVVTPQEEGGNPYLDDLTYVDFAFIVNKYTNNQCSLADLRDACSVTLTDTLPTYTDRNGVSRIAVLDADQNPGWTLSEDGKTVSRTYTGEHSAEILLQIYNDALHLRFPDLRFTAADDGTLMAELSNSVALTAIPSGEAPGETHPEADDPLRFRLTTDPTAQGKFAKGAEKGDICDVEVYKTNPYPWSLALSNGKSQPLRHIVIQDRTIVEDGEVVLAELDEALRFVRLESVTTGASLPEGKTYADLVDHITAYYTDGTTETISALQADAHGNITVTFDGEKVCDGYDIVFAEDYEMQAGGQVRFHAYTVYRDPEHTHVPDGQTKVTYTNAARSINSYPLDGETDDKIAYAFSDATIIAAQSMYAEKFIAPAGSGSWSKQGLLVKARSDFDYLLEIVNETAAVHTGLTVYDTLPRIGNPNLFGASGRGSEFPVRLRGAITPPEGYTVYYTTSDAVYTHSMEEMVDSDIWTTSITDYASVTAFKLVAGEGTVLAGNSTFWVRIPVCALKTFDEDSMALLRAKVDQDQASGTVSWLQAVNAFGFRTVQTPTVKESNTVWARVCFAGFCVKADRGCLHARRNEGPGRVSRHAHFRSRVDHAESRHAGIQRDLQRRSHRSWNIGRPAVHRKPRRLRPAQDRRPRDRCLLRPRRVPAPLRRRPPRPPQTPQPEALRQHSHPIHNAAGAKAPAAFFGKMPGLSVSSCKVLLHMLHFLLEKRTGGTAWIGIVSLRSSRASLRTTTLRRSGCAASWTRRAHISST